MITSSDDLAPDEDGWPGSTVEFMKIIGPLTGPRNHDGDPGDAFHVVAPSLPGFGLSGPTHETGWNTGRVALAWVELMERLGYDRYGAQGGDTGGIILGFSR
jgi:pimeloyl-ACP methyl ester carboxylesterase